MKYIHLIVAILAVTVTSYGQILDYSFDPCTPQSQGSIQVDGSYVGNPNCECGIGTNALSLNGTNDGFVISDTFAKSIGESFTLDFYFQIQSGSGILDIMSMRHNCTADSFITLKYVSFSNILLLEMSIDNGVYYSLEHELSDFCWHRVTFIRSKLDYSLYVDNTLVGVINAVEQVPIDKSATLSFSNSPCLSSSLERMRGKIDEVKLYDRAFSQAELGLTYLYPGRIVTRDTTIFVGESVHFRYGSNCSSSINWSPNTYLDNASSLTPIATPEETTTYTVRTTESGCPEENRVTVYVIDKDKLDCEKILLPTAFTPNGDQLNDEFGISNIFVLEELINFEILDRTGNVVFISKDPARTWDGHFGGRLSDPGVYYARLTYRCKGEEHSFIHNFVLIR